MSSKKKDLVYRVRGFPASKHDDELNTLLSAAIESMLVENEKSAPRFTAAFVPCCYNDKHEKDALLEFHDEIPQFLSELAGNPSRTCQVQIGDIDVNFDCHFYGFTQLYTPTIDAPVTADIIAITGLDGHAYGSWRGKGTLRRMWLRHFLSKDLPCCRTMIYGYDSKLSSPGIDTITEYGRELMEELNKVRNTEDLKQRPLFFIAHSFGGIILAHCLVKSVQATNDDLYKATYGMLLFGIPHKGLILDDIQKMLGEQGNHARSALLKQISNNSDILKFQLLDFTNLIRDRKVVSFYETWQTKQLQFDSESGRYKRTGDNVTLVGTDSALLQLPDQIEEKIPLSADHSTIVKFDSKMDKGYTSARDKLKQFEQDASSVVSARFQLFHLPGGKSMADWISSLPYESHHDFACQNLLSDSGQWLFHSKEFQSWESHDLPAPTVLWLHGMPGSGKTSLMALVINRERKRLKSTGNRLAFFYCQRSSAEPQRSKQRQLFDSLLRQLAFNRNGYLSEPTKRLYEKKQEQAKEGQHEVKRFTEEEVITLLVEIITLQNTTIVIDALDEIDRDERPAFYKALEKISEGTRTYNRGNNHSGVLRLLVSSRNDVDIVLKLSTYRNINIGVEDNQDDIRRFIQRELEKMIFGCHILHGVPKNSQRTICANIEEVLVEKAEGMFQWVSLQMPWISRAQDEQAIYRQLNKMPKGLKESYDQMCQFMEQDCPDNLTLAKNTIKLILAAKQNLQTRDFVTALQMSGECGETVSIEKVLNVCYNLVELDKESNIFRLVHLSVREYFENKDGFRQEDANMFVLSSCIERMKVLGSLAADDADEFWYWTPFGKYAVEYWPQHCEAIGLGGPPEPLRSKVKRLIHKNGVPSETFKLWIHIMGTNTYNSTLSEFQQLRISLVSTTVALPSFIASGYGLLWLLKEDFRHQELGWSSLNDSKDTVLHVASTCGQLDVVKYLLDCGASVEGDQAYALHMAAYYGHEDVLSLLLERNANPNTKIYRPNWGKGRTPLHYAAGHSRSESMTICLLNHNADTEISDEEGLETPLFGALRTSTSVTETLISRGARIDVLSTNGNTALHSAAYAAAHNPLLGRNVTMLLEKGADKFAKDSDGMTPIDYASMNPSITKLFFKEALSDDVLKRRKFGVSSIVRFGSGTTLKYILEQQHDADVNLAHSSGKTALDHALELMAPNKLSVLLRHGARPGLAWDLDSQWIQRWKDEGFFGQLSEVISKPAAPLFVSRFNCVSGSRSDTVYVTPQDPDIPYFELQIPMHLGVVKGILFDTVSHDQGWSDGDELYGGTYQSSCSWFEVGVKYAERTYTDLPIDDSRHFLQSNVHARGYWHWHRNIWDVNDSKQKFWLQTLSPGDTIQVFAKARYQGWECHVQSVKVEIYGEFVDPALREKLIRQSEGLAIGFWSWLDFHHGYFI